MRDGCSQEAKTLERCVLEQDIDKSASRERSLKKTGSEPRMICVIPDRLFLVGSYVKVITVPSAMEMKRVGGEFGRTSATRIERGIAVPGVPSDWVAIVSREWRSSIETDADCQNDTMHDELREFGSVTLEICEEGEKSLDFVGVRSLFVVWKT